MATSKNLSQQQEVLITVVEKKWRKAGASVSKTAVVSLCHAKDLVYHSVSIYGAVSNRKETSDGSSVLRLTLLSGF